jgi:hypothetical protein
MPPGSADRAFEESAAADIAAADEEKKCLRLIFIREE